MLTLEGVVGDALNREDGRVIGLGADFEPGESLLYPRNGVCRAGGSNQRGLQPFGPEAFVRSSRICGAVAVQD
jgi:hypothetical protein